MRDESASSSRPRRSSRSARRSIIASINRIRVVSAPQLPDWLLTRLATVSNVLNSVKRMVINWSGLSTKPIGVTSETSSSSRRTSGVDR